MLIVLALQVSDSLGLQLPAPRREIEVPPAGEATPRGMGEPLSSVLLFAAVCGGNPEWVASRHGPATPCLGRVPISGSRLRPRKEDELREDSVIAHSLVGRLSGRALV